MIRQGVGGALFALFACVTLIVFGQWEAPPGVSNQPPLSTASSVGVSKNSFEFLIPGWRGPILGADGTILAQTVPTGQIAVNWLKFEDEARLLEWAHEKLRLTAKYVLRPRIWSDTEIVDASKNRGFHPLFLSHTLTPSEFQSLDVHRLAEDGLILVPASIRTYSNGSELFHGLGYVRRSQIRGLGAFKEGEVWIDRYTGGSGLEKVFDRELSGKDGSLIVGLKENGDYRSPQVLTAFGTGFTLRTTLDVKMQHIVEKSMASVRCGAAVILKVENSDVVAMVSRPTLDANLFQPWITSELWKKVSTDELLPMLDRTCAAQQPPGSIFKVLTSVAAMRAGVLNPDEVLDCSGTFTVGDMKYRFPSETNSVDYRDAMVISCNTYFMGLGIKAGRDQLIQTARDFGVGQKSGFILPGEVAGRMPNPDFVKKTHQRIMGGGDVANASIGQGDVLVTPLQAANWMACIGNGGQLWVPRLVSNLESPTGELVQTFTNASIRKIELRQTDLALLTHCLIEVVEDGTGLPARIPALSIAAKTGTAQVGRKDKPRQVAWMNGFVPAEHPQYAFAVMIEGAWEDDLHGGDHVGPIVKNIFSEIFQIPKKKK